jgi:hypothetical protein
MKYPFLLYQPVFLCDRIQSPMQATARKGAFAKTMLVLARFDHNDTLPYSIYSVNHYLNADMRTKQNRLRLAAGSVFGKNEKPWDSVPNPATLLKSVWP